jgi:hypothetical protein
MFDDDDDVTSILRRKRKRESLLLNALKLSGKKLRNPKCRRKWKKKNEYYFCTLLRSGSSEKRERVKKERSRARKREREKRVRLCRLYLHSVSHSFV